MRRILSSLFLSFFSTLVLQKATICRSEQPFLQMSQSVQWKLDWFWCNLCRGVFCSPWEHIASPLRAINVSIFDPLLRYGMWRNRLLTEVDYFDHSVPLLQTNILCSGVASPYGAPSCMVLSRVISWRAGDPCHWRSERIQKSYTHVTRSAALQSLSLTLQRIHSFSETDDAEEYDERWMSCCIQFV